MGLPFPDEAPDVWNHPVIGGEKLPGIWTVSVEASEELDVKKPKGKSGARITKQGRNPAKVKLVGTLTEGADSDTFWDLYRRKIRPPVSAPSPEPLSIEHPKTARHGISALEFEKISDPPNERGDEEKITIEFYEFAPPPEGPGTSKTKTSSRLDPRKQNLSEDITNAPPPKPSAGNTGPGP